MASDYCEEVASAVLGLRPAAAPACVRAADFKVARAADAHWVLEVEAPAWWPDHRERFAVDVAEPPERVASRVLAWLLAVKAAHFERAWRASLASPGEGSEVVESYDLTAVATVAGAPVFCRKRVAGRSRPYGRLTFRGHDGRELEFEVGAELVERAMPGFRGDLVVGHFVVSGLVPAEAGGPRP